MAAPPLVDLTEGDQKPRPEGSLQARVAMVAKRTLRKEVQRMQVPLRRPELPEYMRPGIFRAEDHAPEDLPFFMRPGRFWATKYPDSDTDEDSYMERVKEGLERLE